MNKKYLLSMAMLGMSLGLSAAKAKTKTTINPDSQGKNKATNMTYVSCRQDILQAFEQKKISKDKLSEQLNVCNERFPAAALYKDCKANAFLKFKNNQTLAENAMKYCNLILQATTYDENALIPVQPIAGQIFYAGIGLNKTLPLADHQLPNFDCDKIKPAASQLAEAEYVLFGNEPKLFKGFEALPGKTYADKFQLTAKDQDYKYIKNLGRIFAGTPKNPSLLFFPSSYCMFSGFLGKHFQDHKVFYLIDAKEKKLTPYFAVSFFKSKRKSLTSEEYAHLLAKRLGPKFMVQERGPRLWLVSEQPIKEFDDEGDPKNVCRFARGIIGIVKNAAHNKAMPEYFLVANTKNLCEFGDRLSLSSQIR